MRFWVFLGNLRSGVVWGLRCPNRKTAIAAISNRSIIAAISDRRALRKIAAESPRNLMNMSVESQQNSLRFQIAGQLDSKLLAIWGICAGNLFPLTSARLFLPHPKTHPSHVRATSEPYPNQIRATSEILAEVKGKRFPAGIWGDLESQEALVQTTACQRVRQRMCCKSSCLLESITPQGGVA